MQAFKDLISTDYGLLSLASLGFIIGMAAFFIRYFVSHMRQDEAREGKPR